MQDREAIHIEHDQRKSSKVLRLLFEIAPYSSLEFVSLSALVVQPITVRGLLGAIATDRHAAPPSCSPAGMIGEQQRAAASGACFHVGEIFLAHKLRERFAERQQ